METIGFSKKVAAAVLAACGSQLVALTINLGTTGKWDRGEWLQLLGVALTAAFGVASGYLAPPNDVAISDAIPAGSVEP